MLNEFVFKDNSWKDQWECQKEDWGYSIYSSKSDLWVFSKDLVMIRF
jgi:hypothetical protein